MLLLLLLLRPLALAMVDFSPSSALDLCCPRVSRLASRVTYTAMLQNTCNEFVGALEPPDPPLLLIHRVRPRGPKPYFAPKGRAALKIGVTPVYTHNVVELEFC